MKKLLLYVLCSITAIIATGCFDDKVEDEYKDWREANDEWFAAQCANTAYYTTVTAPWDDNARVLIHWFNDTMATRTALRPLFSSTVDVKYRGMTKDATPFDSSYLNTSPADSLLRVQLNSGVIEGWAVALPRMHVGDSCRVVIPYSLAYGSTKRNSIVLPYTSLVFDIKLVSIYGYETH